MFRPQLRRINWTTARPPHRSGDCSPRHLELTSFTRAKLVSRRVRARSAVSRTFRSLALCHSHPMDDSHASELAESDNRDRLSELPEPLILEILSLLPMRELVNMSLLSKLFYKYNDFWTTVPCLEFRDHSSNIDAFVNFVSGALALWKGSKIRRFDIVLSIIDYVSDSFTSNLDSWLHFAIDKQVEELSVNLSDCQVILYWPIWPYCAPQCLYSCSSLRKLSLASCGLKIDDHVQWNQLQSLTLEVDQLGEDVMVQILSGAPLLEILNLRIVDSNDNLNIQSTSLKILNINRFPKDPEYNFNRLVKFPYHDYYYLYRGWRDTMLEIWAPNLETLEILGASYGRYSLNVPSVTNTVLGFCYGSFILDGYNEEVLVQVLLSIHHAEKIILSETCLKAIIAMKKGRRNLPILDATFLKICVGAADEILCVLEMFPKLMVLIVELRDPLPKFNYNVLFGDLNIHHRDKNPSIIEFDAVILCSALLHLRKVEITWLLCDTSISQVVEIVLQNAPVLEKMVFRAIPFFDRELLCVVGEKFLSMPRSSPNAEVILRRFIESSCVAVASNT